MKDLDNNNFNDGERGPSSYCCSPSSVQTHRHKLSKKKTLHKRIKVPEVVREYSDAENALLYQIVWGELEEINVPGKKYRAYKPGKLLKPSKRKRRAAYKETPLDVVKKFIHILELNGATQKKGVRMSRDQIGLIFGSNNTANKLFKALEGKIIIVGDYSNYKEHIARHIKFHPNFVNADVYEAMTKKFTKKI
jgi:hypothetical protein